MFLENSSMDSLIKNFGLLRGMVKASDRKITNLEKSNVEKDKKINELENEIKKLNNEIKSLKADIKNINIIIAEFKKSNTLQKNVGFYGNVESNSINNINAENNSINVNKNSAGYSDNINENNINNFNRAIILKNFSKFVKTSLTYSSDGRVEEDLKKEDIYKFFYKCNSSKRGYIEIFPDPKVVNSDKVRYLNNFFDISDKDKGGVRVIRPCIISGTSFGYYSFVSKGIVEK